MQDYFSYINDLMDEGRRNAGEPLKGLKVLDLSRIIFGPVATRWMGLFGAEVIKVEEPLEGDYWRVGGAYWAKYWKDSSLNFHYINYNKYFIAIDLNTVKGKELVLELAKQADVVVENYRAGLMEAWGVGYTTVSKINPRVIYMSCSGYGQWGPLRFFPSYDIIAQSMAGCAMLTGFPGQQPYKLPDFFGDYLPGLAGAMGLMAALNYRERAGKGQYIDMAQTEALMRIMNNWSYISETGEDIGLTGNSDPTMSPSGIFKTADDKFIAISIATDIQFQSLVKAMQREDLAALELSRDTFQRLLPANAELLDKAVAGWAATRSQADILDSARAYGFAAAAVADDLEIAGDDWRRQRGSIVDFDDQMYEKVTVPVLPAALSKSPARLKWLGRPVGYHNRYVLRKYLGYSLDKIRLLEKEGIIGYWDNKVSLRPPQYYDMQKDPVYCEGAGETDESK